MQHLEKISQIAYVYNRDKDRILITQLHNLRGFEIQFLIATDQKVSIHIQKKESIMDLLVMISMFSEYKFGRNIQKNDMEIWLIDYLSKIGLESFIFYNNNPYTSSVNKRAMICHIADVFGYIAPGYKAFPLWEIIRTTGFHELLPT